MIIPFTHLFYILGKLEADDAGLSLVYEYFGKLHKHFDHEHDDIIKKVVETRFQFLYSDSMGLAYMFTPKFSAAGYYFDDDRREILGYAKVWALKNRPEIADKVHQEMIDFVTKMATLSVHQQETVFAMSARSYWNVFGRHEHPALYEVAKPVVEMVCSSAASERGWSTFRFIHSRLRNRLSNDRVKKLVFVFTNCAMLDQEDKYDYIFEDGAVINGSDCEEND